MNTLMAIGAHHDDVELRCGGTLAKYVRSGWRVVYAIACTTPYYFPDEEQKRTGRYLTNVEAMNLRKAEATAGAKALGVREGDIHFFDYRSLYWYKDGTHEFQYFEGVHHRSPDLVHYLEEQIPGRGYVMSAHRSPEGVDFLADFIERHRTDLLLTHHPDDGHWEHYGTCRLVMSALRKLKEGGRPGPRAYGWEPGSGGSLAASFAPTHFEDIAATLETKDDALRCFPSQFRDHDTAPFVTRSRQRAKAWGRSAGLEAAEPFMPLNVDDRGGGYDENLATPAGWILERPTLNL